jgi:hypothetical protein
MEAILKREPNVNVDSSMYNQKRAFPRSLLRNNRVRSGDEQAGEKEPQCIRVDLSLRVSRKV